jgi:hypothetical protein
VVNPSAGMNPRPAVSFFRALCERVARSFRDPEVCLAVVRVGLALIFLARHNDYLRGVLDLKHHRWVYGPEFGPATLGQVEPILDSPLWPGMDLLLPFAGVLVNVRTALAVLLLLGVFPKLNATLLAVVSFGLLAMDRFHYTHHLWVLYTSLALLGLGGLKKAWPAFPDSLALIRGHVAVIYGAAGLAKLTPSWLSGQELQALVHEGFVRSALVERLSERVGWGPLASFVCMTELALPVLLVVPKWRLWGVGSALVLHAGIHSAMSVSTFGVTMVVLLLAFMPDTLQAAEPTLAAVATGRRLEAVWPGAGRRGAGRPGAGRQVAIAVFAAALSPFGALFWHTRVGSYRMFTALTRYELTLRVDGAAVPRSLLLPHLGRDGARIVRLANGVGIGETNAELLEGALPDVAGLLCRTVPHAKEAEASLALRELTGRSERTVRSRRTCARQPARS